LSKTYVIKGTIFFHS